MPDYSASRHNKSALNSPVNAADQPSENFATEPLFHSECFLCFTDRVQVSIDEEPACVSPVTTLVELPPDYYDFKEMILSGKIAVVTGASRGLGRAIAYRLAQEGAAVAINYSQHREGADSLAFEIRNIGGTAMTYQCDVANADQVRAMVDSISAELGPVEILVNNAAVLYRADLEQYDQPRFEEMRRVNVGGIINTTAAVAESMKHRRFGRIINLTSIAAHGTSLPGTTFYAATKAAVILLTRRFAMDLGPFGITVNAIAPGFIQTDMTADRVEEIVDRVVAVTMVRRVGKPEDIANAIAFLSSPESGFITAQTLTVDGGRMDYIAHP